VTNAGICPLTCFVGFWSGSRFCRFSKASLEQGFIHPQVTLQEWCTIANSIVNAWYIRSGPILLVLCCSREVLADPAPLFSPTNIFAPASTPAHSIFGLSLFVLAVTGAIFAIVFSLLVYAVAKFRRRNDDGREPPQVYGSNQVEVAWTVIPILIVVALFMATARVIAISRRLTVSQCHRSCRHRPSVLVGISLSGTKRRNRERIACAGKRSRTSNADFHQVAIGRYGPQFLGPTTGG